MRAVDDKARIQSSRADLLQGKKGVSSDIYCNLISSFHHGEF